MVEALSPISCSCTALEQRSSPCVCRMGTNSARKGANRLEQAWSAAFHATRSASRTSTP